MIYQLKIFHRYYWISRYSSDEHVYMQCSWCKSKQSIFTTRGVEISRSAKAQLKFEFFAIHRECVDPTEQSALAC